MKKSTLVFTAILWVALSSLGFAPSACASTSSGAGVVVRFGEGQEHHYCSAIDGESASGLELLNATGLRVATKDFGGSLGMAVCKIEDVGTDPSDCPSASGYWHYWHYEGGDWVESSLGAANYMVRAGSIEGWTWEVGDAATPPSIGVAQSDCESAPEAPGPLAQDVSSLRVGAVTIITLGLVGALMVTLAWVLRRRMR